LTVPLEVLTTALNFAHFNDRDFMVMVRPLSGATALPEAMSAQFERIQQEALELADQVTRA
jgi:hypothetical protein